jgi:two-component system chemotaxis response regulator CheY
VATDLRREVLVVDDDSDIREIVSELLIAEGFDVAQADNGRHALDAVATHRPDAIVLDLMMPVMNGWEFLEERRRSKALGSIPVVVVTASEVEGASDVSAVLSKPFDGRALVDTLRRVSQPRGPVSPAWHCGAP